MWNHGISVFKKLIHTSDPTAVQTQEENKDPKSSELGFNPKLHQSSEADSLSAVVMEDEKLKHQDQQHQEQLIEGFGDRFDSENAPVEDGDLKKVLDEEIHQVIYREALHEAVMNLALEDRNALGSEVSLRDSVREEIGGKMLSGLGEGSETYEKDEKIIEVNGESSDAKGKTRDFDENEWPIGKEGDDSEVEEHYETEEGENGGNPLLSNEDGRYNDARNYSKRVLYPLRPDADDCAYYMKTGNCKFGANCKFNHPPKRRNQGVNKEKPKPKEDFERPVQTECKYYLTSGGCKFGKACKYSHSRERNIVAPVLEFNFLGLPIRVGEKECPYYMRTVSCKYGSNCRFNHPDPTSVSGPDPLSGYGNGASVQLQGASQSTPASWPSLPNPVIFAPTHANPPSNPEWNSYQAPTYPTSEKSLPTPPAFAMNNPPNESNFYSHHRQQMPIDEYPERPGQPECSYFLKTGDCKYKSNCRYHHPKARISKPASCPLSEKGLPLRPDQSICSFYSRYGICKYGPACKFDHPENWGDTAPSSIGARMMRQEMEAGLS